MREFDPSIVDEIDISNQSPEEAALSILIELRDVGFGRHRAEVLVQYFGSVFDSRQTAEEALEGLRSRGLVAKSHARGEFYYRPTKQALERQDTRTQ